jgi:hypothetical protein
LIKKTDSGEITCSVIPGLTIPVTSIFDKLINLEVIAKILTA